MESVCTLIRTEGSNPSLSAKHETAPLAGAFLCLIDMETRIRGEDLTDLPGANRNSRRLARRGKYMDVFSNPCNC